MKENIEQLAALAGFCFWKDEHWGPGPGKVDWSVNYTDELEKFAELLINECANTARDYAQHFTDDDTALFLRKQILEYFDSE